MAPTRPLASPLRASAPSWGLPPPHPRPMCVTFNQVRDNRRSLRGGTPWGGGARLQVGAPGRSRPPTGRTLSVASKLAPSPFGDSSPSRALATPLRAPTPLQKRCLVVLRTTKRIYLLALTDAPVKERTLLRGVVRACRHPTNLRGVLIFPHCRAVYMFKRGLLAPLLGAPPITGAFGRGGVPRPQSLGGPPLPSSLHPAPFGRAPPRWSGLRECGSRATPSAFLSAGAGNQNAALSLLLGVPHCVPLRPLRVRRGILVSRSRTDKAIFQNSRHCWNLFSPPRPYSNNVWNFKKPTAKK